MRKILKPQALILDMDGVMIDSEPLYAFRLSSFIYFGLGYEPDMYLINENVGLGPVAVWKLTEKQIDGSMGYEEFQQRMDAYTDQFPIDYMSIKNPGLDELLAFCRSNGIKTAIASSSDKSHIETVIDGLGVGRQIDYYLSGEHAKRYKPHPDIYLEVAEELGVVPEACVVIEDSEAGILSGTRAGMTVIAKREERYNFVQEGYDFIIDHLYEAIPILEQSLTLSMNNKSVNNKMEETKC